MFNFFKKSQKVKVVAFTKAFLRAILKIPRRNENECCNLCPILKQ